MPKENESPWASNHRIARIFLDAAHDDLERPVRERSLQLRPLEPFAPICDAFRTCHDFQVESAFESKAEVGALSLPGQLLALGGHSQNGHLWTGRVEPYFFKI